MSPFELNSFLQSQTLGPKTLYGHYVYQWLDNGTIFYIGSGTNRRAWNQHNPNAEYIRQISTNFMVQILQHHLNKEYAHRLERKYIRKAFSDGILLTNQRIPNGT